MTTQTCQCTCGSTTIEVTEKPLFRILCHCGICQKYNQSSHADILVFKAKQVKISAQSKIKFQTYKKPPNVNRGQCSACGQATIEIFNMPLMPKLTMIPAAMFINDVVDGTQLPEPKAHMFYEKRVKDAEDDLPKYKGFVPSQWAFFKYLWFKR